MKPDHTLMKAHWEAQAAHYDLRRKLSEVDRRILEVLKSLNIRTLVEIGCGSGLIVQQIQEQRPELTYVGVDLAANFLRITKNRLTHSGNLVQADALALPFAAESCSCVLEMDAIHHVPRGYLTKIIREVARILQPGGHFLLAEDWAVPPETEVHIIAQKLKNMRPLTREGLEYHPSEAEWIEILKQAQFSVIKHEYLDRPLSVEIFANLSDPEATILLERLRVLGEHQPLTIRMVFFHCVKA